MDFFYKKNTVKLSEIPLNICVKVIKILDKYPKIYRRLLELGFVKNTKIVLLNKSLSGNAFEVKIRDNVLAIRNEIADQILVVKCE